MNQTAEVEIGVDRVSCLVATLSDRKCLLPITAVAEVINTVTLPQAGEDKTPLYGWLNWRDQKIPVISMENAMGGERPQLKMENRLAVLNAAGDASGLGFYAVVLQSLPKPVQVSAETILAQQGKADKLSLGEVSVGEENVSLPDLLAVETLVSRFKQS